MADGEQPVVEVPKAGGQAVDLERAVVVLPATEVSARVRAYFCPLVSRRPAAAPLRPGHQRLELHVGRLRVAGRGRRHNFSSPSVL